MLWGFFLYIVIMQDAFLWYKSYKLEKERKEKKISHKIRPYVLLL